MITINGIVLSRFNELLVRRPLVGGGRCLLNKTGLTKRDGCSCGSLFSFKFMAVDILIPRGVAGNYVNAVIWRTLTILTLPFSFLIMHLFCTHES